MRLFDKQFRNGADHRLSHIDLDNRNISYEGIRDGVRVWTSPDGDPIGLSFFDIPPDLPRENVSVEAFTHEYRSSVDADLVELGIDRVDGVRVVRTIVKVPQSAHGMTYVGALTFPFRKCSYVLKIICEEVGTTGSREAFDSDFPDHPLSRCRRSLGLIDTAARVSDEIRRMDAYILPDAN